MAMVTKTIEIHPWKLSYNFDDEKIWTETDEALHQKFKEIFERQHALKERIHDSLTPHSEIENDVKRVREFLMLVKDLTKDARDEADYFMECIKNMQDFSVEAMIEKVNLATNALEEYHPKLTELVPKIDTLSKFLTSYIEEDEDGTIWEEFSEITTKHYSNYDDNAIDIVTFDRASEMLRTYNKCWSDHSKEIYQMQDRYIVDYNKLLLETQGEYDLWQEFSKRYEILKNVVKVAVPTVDTNDLNLN